MSLFFVSLLTAFIVGHPVPVMCDYVGGHAGEYISAREVIVLDPIVCSGFTAAVGSRAQAVAVYDLTHESEHARGVMDESRAECATLIDFPRVVKRLSLSPRLLRFARSIHAAMPPAYQGVC